MNRRLSGNAASTLVPDTRPAVCIVGPLPPPSGGMANQCEQLIRLLRKEGVTVELVRSNSVYRPHWIGGVPILRAGFRLLPYLFRLWKCAGQVGVMHILANSGWAWHLFAAPAVVIGRARGAKVIVNYHGGEAAAFLSGAPQFVLSTLRLADACVVPSSFLLGVFKRHGLGAVIVPNVVDLSRFIPAPVRDFGDAPHLIVTRNLESIYDIPTAIRAFAIVRESLTNARLTVAGSGPELGRLKTFVRDLGLQACVCFSGRIDNSDIPALYFSADCILNPSTVDNMPISILEAFACGIPVVTTDAGGIPDLVDDGVSALLVRVSDHSRMGEQAVRVLTEPMLAASLRRNGLVAAQKYAWPAVRKHWLRLYCRTASDDEGIK